MKPMKFEDLTEVYREEKSKGLLTEVRSDLYPAMSDLLVSLRTEYDRLLSEDPDSIMCEGANHRRRRASRLVRDVISMRMNKVSSMALRAAGGAKTSTEILTEEEKRFHNSVLEAANVLMASVDRVTRNVKYKIPPIESTPKAAPHPVPVVSEKMALKDMPVMDDFPDDDYIPDVDDMRDDADIQEVVPMDEVPVERSVRTEEVPEEKPEQLKELSDEMISSPEADIENDVDDLDEDMYVLIRILDDLEEFVGPDRNYDLKREELVTMPKSMADALVMRGKAVTVKPSL